MRNVLMMASCLKLLNIDASGGAEKFPTNNDLNIHVECIN